MKDFGNACTLGGHTLPSEFNGGSRVDDVAINRDGTQFAYIDDRTLVIGDVPPDGNIHRPGSTITVKRNADGGISVSCPNANNIIGASFGTIPDGKVNVAVEKKTVGPGESIVGVSIGKLW